MTVVRNGVTLRRLSTSWSRCQPDAPRGGMTQEANAPGKAWGYADVGPISWKVEWPKGVHAVSTDNRPIYSWDSLPWLDHERDVFRLQKRIYQASLNGDKPKVRSLQKLLLNGRAAKLLAVRRVSQDNSGKHTPGVDGICSLTDEQRLELAARLVVGAKADPVRRVHIPKPGTDELRPLGIP